MGAPRREKIREKLAAPSPAPPRTFLGWLDRSPEALEFVETWLDMAAKGETDWGVRRVLTELQREYGCPFKYNPTMYGHLSRRFGDRYEAAVRGRR